MSGIIFNGQEMKEGENTEDYINRVINDTVNETMNNEYVKPKNDYKLLHEINGIRLYIHEDNVKEHNELIKRIENKKSLDVSDIDSTDDESDETDESDEEQEQGDITYKQLGRVFRDLKSNMNDYKNTLIKSNIEYEYIMNHYFFKSRVYIHRQRKNTYDYKINDIFYFNTSNQLYLYNMWQITKEDKKHIYAKRLKPYNILTHKNQYTKNDINIYMYEFNNFEEDFKEKQFNKSESRIIINMYNICHLFYKVVGIPKGIY